MALILLTHARRKARYIKGGYIPLADQDRSLWEQKRILEGQNILETALKRGQVGPYQIQASIAALHCEAGFADATDWAQIAALYRLLAQMEPSAIVLLNLAVAMSYGEGAAKALEVMAPIAQELQAYQPFHAAKADMLRRIGQGQEAIAAYHRALDLTQSQSERAFLENRLAQLLE